MKSLARCRRATHGVSLALALTFSLPAFAEIGQIKVTKGQVTVERAGQSLPGAVGLRLETADALKTGADGSVGITMSDNSLAFGRTEQHPVARSVRIRCHEPGGPLRRAAAARDAGGHLRTHRQAVARCDDGAHAVGGYWACAAPNSWCRRVT